MIEIYTDGSTKGNGKDENSGGFGVCCLVKDSNTKSGFLSIYTHKEQHKNTTNNRMELQAILHALNLTQTEYKNNSCIIKSDSAYCVNMINNWIYTWYNNNWKKSNNKEIENLDLVKQIWKYCKIDFPNFKIEKVPGHSNIIGNIIADALATNNETEFNKNISYCLRDILF